MEKLPHERINRRNCAAGAAYKGVARVANENRMSAAAMTGRGKPKREKTWFVSWAMKDRDKPRARRPLFMEDRGTR
jgi:hypothetical protein